MNSFEQIGSAQLLAFEGQRQIGAAMARAIGRALVRALNGLGRRLPDRSYAPW
jgi:hypothetical protein